MNKIRSALNKPKNLLFALLILLSSALLLLSSACITTSLLSSHKRHSQDGKQTLVVAKSRLYRGMSQANVLEIMRYPVTIKPKNSEADETWIYLMDSDASASTQETTTLVIKFDTNKRIKEFSYKTGH